MAGLINNNGTYWAYLGRVDGKQVRRSTKVPVRAATPALAREQKLKAEAVAVAMRNEWQLQKHGLTSAPSEEAPTFAAFSEQWEQEWGKLQRGYEGRVTYRLKKLVEAFGRYRLTEITPALVHTWRTSRLKDGVATRTVNRDIDDLKAILQRGVPRYYAQSPLWGMKRLKPAPSVIKTLSAEDEKRLLEALDPHDKGVFLVALDGLVRLGDVLALKWEDIADGMAHIRHSKNGRSYSVPLSTRAQAAVDALRPDPCDPSALVFAALIHPSQTEKQRTDAYIARLRRTCERIKVAYGRKVGGVTFHSATRHTGATRLVKAGVDLRTVQVAGGWASLTMLQRYVHPDREQLRVAVEKIGAS